MYAVGRIGSYISRGVYTVSGPFHPFGGAVDIIVVEQPDGSFKSSPWYVRFGKFQGVLKTREKIVRINVNGVEADFHMYLDHKGEAYFLKEVDVDEGESVLLYPSSSGDETDGGSNGSNDNKRTLESQSCKFDGTVINTMDQIDSSNGKIVARSGSRRARLLGLVFGRRSMKKDGYKVDEGRGEDIARLSSLERAEIAADLLEVKWSTNLASSGFNKDTVTSEISKGTSDDYVATFVQSDGDLTQVDSSVCDDGKSCRDSSVLQAEIGSANEQIAVISQSTLMNTEGSVAGIASMISGTIVDEKCEVVSESNKSDDFGVTNGGHGEYGGEISCGSEVKHNLQTHNVIYCKTSESSMVGLSALNEQMQETLYVAGERCGEIHVRVDTLHVKPEQPSEDADIEKEVVDVSQNHFVKKTGYDPASGLVEELKSQHIDTNPEVQDEKSTFPESIANSQMLDKAARDLFSGSSEDEQFLFSDLDESKLSEVRQMDSSSPDCLKKDNDSAQTGEGTKDSEFCPSPDLFVKDNQAADFGNNSEALRVISTPIAILRTQKNGEEVGRLAESLPNMWTPTFRVGVLDHHPLSHSMNSNAKSSKPALLEENDSSNTDSATDKEQPLVEGKHNGDSSKTVVPSGGSWRLWPFPFRRSGSGKAMQPVPVDSQSSGAEIALGSINTNVADTEIASEERSDTMRPSEEVITESVSGTDGAKNLPTAAVGKKMVRSITPTSEQLASLNLKEGRNIVTFTFSTAMLGKQQVDANIYLWKWNTRIVISDVDGTITKSDVLGQFMPLVGMDWSQTGVAHLFSAIKENGYQLLFLSARAISQAYHTRQFLFNLKQDGKALPDGPVVISPDGLFPSLFREVIRRAPHEFKIACLEKIRDLFPSDCSPFYAGFGNRDTDELSYLKVGIPRGKIFTINPKGEVAVNRLVDTKSYSSLHSLVHGMFPPTTSSEQEDFNSWNYWKLPQLGIDF